MSTATATTIRERPIIFSAESVRAILGGHKDTTRRVIKPQPPFRSNLRHFDGEKASFCFGNHDRSLGCEEDLIVKCPLGRAGERLWVREKWSPIERDEDMVDGIRYSDDAFIPIENTEDAAHQWIDAANNDHSGRWRSPIHMPRWAARITLEIVSVRVERLQSITPEEVKAEGFKCLTKDNGTTWKWGIADNDGLPGADDFGWHWKEWEVDPKKAFARGWDKINGKRAGCDSESNPFVFRVAFKRLSK